MGQPETVIEVTERQKRAGRAVIEAAKELQLVVREAEREGLTVAVSRLENPSRVAAKVTLERKELVAWTDVEDKK